MPREIQAARHNPLMVGSDRFGYSSEDARRFWLLEFPMFGRQLALQEAPTRFVDMFRRALESAGESPALESQEKSLAKFNSSRIFQNFGSTGQSGVFVARPSSSTESVVGIAGALVSMIDEAEDNLAIWSATRGYQRLATFRDKLVDENENSPLPSSVFFIGNLIEKYEEESNIIVLPEPTKEKKVKHRSESLFHLGSRGLEAAYCDNEPEYTMDMLIAVNPDYEGNDIELHSGKHSFVRGLEAAYHDDEPEYTTDILIEVNPDYEKE